MRRFHLYIRTPIETQWHYAVTCDNASQAWEGMMMARERGFVVSAQPVGLPTPAPTPEQVAQ